VRYASLGSGSRGNGTLVEYLNTCLLIDCGFSLRETELRLGSKGKNAKDLDAILVTHEHSDHVGGVGALARKYRIPVYLTAGTLRSGRLGELPRCELINSHQTFRVGDLAVQPVPVPHDANEPCQYIIGHGSQKLGVLTDLGSITTFVQQRYTGLDALLLACNHDTDMLREGPYPYPLKQRVCGKYCHLSNAQAVDLLNRIGLEKLQHLVVSHISQQNNSVERVLAKIKQVIDIKKLIVADQEIGFDWLTIN